MNSNTITPLKPKENPQSPRVQIRAFNSNNGRWKRESLDWLREMRSKGFECVEGHTLTITESSREAWFNIYVVEKVPGPIKPLPPKIYFDHFEVDARFGHAINVNCGQSPPVTEIHWHFWQQPQEGDAPHFDAVVMPLVDKLVAHFKTRGSLWVS